MATPHPASILPVSELEERIAIAEVLRDQLDDEDPTMSAFAVREAQCRLALAACRAQHFTVKTRRALSAKVLDLEVDTRAAVCATWRARLQSGAA